MSTQLALFIDGPLIGEVHALPSMTMVHTVRVYEETPPMFPTSLQDLQDVTPSPFNTIIYRPVMMGILSKLALWSYKPDKEALESFVSLISPALEITSAAERLIRSTLV